MNQPTQPTISPHRVALARPVLFLAAILASAAASEDGWLIVFDEAPMRVTYLQSPLFDADGLPPALDVLGLNLWQEGQPVVSDIRTGIPLGLQVYLRPTGLIPDNSVLMFRIVGAGPPFEQKVPLESITAPVGVLFDMRATMTLWRVRSNGRSILEIVYVPAGGLQAADILYRTPVFVAPAWKESDVTLTEVQAVHPEVDALLGKRFRLGADAQLSFDLAADAQGAMKSLTLLSSMAHARHIRQGETIAYLRLIGRDGNTIADAPIRAGIETSMSDIEVVEGDVDVKQIDVFASEPLAGSHARQHVYITRIPFAIDQPVRAIQVEYVHEEGLVEVADMGFALDD